MLCDFHCHSLVNRLAFHCCFAVDVRINEGSLRFLYKRMTAFDARIDNCLTSMKLSFGNATDLKFLAIVESSNFFFKLLQHTHTHTKCNMRLWDNSFRDWLLS